MCGIFGVYASARATANCVDLQSLTDDLFRLSESRGKEAAGIALLADDDICVYKVPVTATQMLRRRDYRALYDRVAVALGRPQDQRGPVALVGHSRLVTNGLEVVHDNNQPVVSGGVVGVHNGIVVNEGALWHRNPALQRQSEVDTEVIFQLMRQEFGAQKHLTQAAGKVFQDIYGESTIVALFAEFDTALLATNTGSLYLMESREYGVLVFASERYILEQLQLRRTGRRLLARGSIRHIAAGRGLLLRLGNLEQKPLELGAPPSLNGAFERKNSGRRVSDVSPPEYSKHLKSEAPVIGGRATIPADLERRFARNTDLIAHLRRCTRCVLPATMPFIEFDADGVCNFCRYYTPIKLHGRAALDRDVATLRAKDGNHDCLLSFSGGRDSSYGLHYVVRELGLKPIVYTYDWGMVTDLARRNQARMCGKLGIEHIWVSADIRMKRANIRRNVSAWLAKPDLGMIPLFMAGDKQFLYHVAQVQKQTRAKSIVMCENLLEKTDFKSGFCGIPPAHANQSVYSLSVGNKVRMIGYYGRQFLTNPRYLNASLADTIAAYASYYVITHNWLSLFRYVEWNEVEIESVLRSEYDWEVAADTRSTWRIGDGTAPFYNFIYYNVAGFTENDTFRSNQIREGKLGRAEALTRVNEDNRPRFDSMKWYCDIIGIDLVSALQRIAEIPARWETR